MFRFALVGFLVGSFWCTPGISGTYEYHPNSVLKLGGTFDPKNLTVSYPSCIRYEREYAVHRLNRKQEAVSPQPGNPPSPSPPKKNKMMGVKGPVVIPDLAMDAKASASPGTPEATPAAPVPAAGGSPAPGTGAAVPGGTAGPDDFPNVTAGTDFSIEQIKTREHLYKFLNISTSISGQYKFFSASASMNYESEETFDSDSFVFGVRGMTTFAEIGLIDPRLSDDAKNITDIQAFYARCGREWVSQETRGVMIAVVYTIRNVSQSQRSKLEASISGGFSSPVLKIDVEGKLKQIFESAFVSNYYSAKVHTIGGKGIQGFAQTVTQITQPEKVLEAISTYIQTLDYEASVPLSFTTGTLDQFLVEQRPNLLFDPYNRRIADLFLAYEEYRAQRLRLWKFVNDDNQAAWEKKVDDEAWKRIGVLDTTLNRIESKANVCRKVGEIAADLATATRTASRNFVPSETDRSKAEFVKDFSIGISSNFVRQPAKDYLKMLSTKKDLDPAKFKAVESECPVNDKADEVAVARGLLCDCLRVDDDVYVKDRFSLVSTPSVTVIHDVDTFKPRSLLYVSVAFGGKLDAVRIVSNDNQTVQDLRGVVDPNAGPVWFGSVLYRDGAGSPPAPNKLPYFVEIKDTYGRIFTKPIVPLN